MSRFYGKGTNSAGLPIRKGMQQLKILAQDVRIDIMDKIKDIEQFREKRPKSKADPVEFHGGNSKAGTARSPKSCISSR